MTAVWSMRLTLAGFVLLALVGGMASDGRAQGRDRALESVRELAARLIGKTEDAATPESQIWAGVQALTDATRRFALAETETRADDKVASPPLASLRPGQAENVTRAGEPGAEVPLSDVPRDWFNARITDAQIALNGARTAIEQGATRERIVRHLRDYAAALAILDRPPAS